MIVRSPPRLERTRDPRAASPPLDRIVPPPCRDRSTGRCHGGACSGCAGRRACLRPHRGLDSLGHLPLPPVAALAGARTGQVASASRWRASAIVSAVLIDVSNGEQSTCPRARTGGSRTPGDRVIVRKPPPSARTRGHRAASPPLDRIVQSPCGTGLRPASVAAALAPAVPVAAPASSAPWPRCSRPPPTAASRRARGRSRTARRLGGRLAMLDNVGFQPSRSSDQANGRARQCARLRDRADATPRSASPTSRSANRARISAPDPSRAHWQLRRSRRTGQRTSAGKTVAMCKHEIARRCREPCPASPAPRRRKREPSPARIPRHHHRLAALDNLGPWLRWSPNQPQCQARQCACLRPRADAIPPSARTTSRSGIAPPPPLSTDAPTPRQPAGPEACLNHPCPCFLRVFAHCARNARVCSREPGQAVTSDPSRANFWKSGSWTGPRDRPVRALSLMRRSG